LPGHVESLSHELCEKAWSIFRHRKTGKHPTSLREQASDPIVEPRPTSCPRIRRRRGASHEPHSRFSIPWETAEGEVRNGK
jgi:hypothetical protein